MDNTKLSYSSYDGSFVFYEEPEEIASNATANVTLDKIDIIIEDRMNG